MLYSIVGMLAVILDQAVKFWVSNTLFGTDIVKFIPGVISLVNVHNDGCAFSFLSGSGARVYFIVVTGIFTVLVMIALATNFISGKVARWSIVMVTAGGLGNCIDRIIYGYVQDMFKVELFNFAIFNVADVFITVFAIIFVIAMLFEKPEDDDEEEDEDEDEEDDEDDYYEEEPPKRKERKSPLAAMKKDRSEEQPAPRSAKLKRQEQSEPDYREERPRTEQRPRPAAPQRRPVAEAPDPFADWERANARANSTRSGSYAARAMGEDAPRYTPPARSAAPQRRPVADPAAYEPPVTAAEKPPVYNPPVRTETPAAPRPRPAAPVQERPAAPASAPKPAAKPASSGSFDLDDILAEFK